jgi:glutaredoxin
VPPPNAKNVQKKAAASGESAPAPLPYALQQAVKNFPVTLYTAQSCDPCDRARELLDKRGVPYKDVTVADKEGVEKLKSLAGTGGVPVMTVGRETYGKGFSSETYSAALDAAGYPATSQLPAGVQARQSVKPAEKPAPATAAGQGAGADAPK